MNTLTVDQINQLAGENPEKLIFDCEKEFSNQIMNIVEKIKNNKIKYVFISGPTSSGKTTFSKKFAHYLREFNHVDISLDDYYKPLEEMPLKKDNDYNFETIKSLNLESMYEDFKLLKEGKEVAIPLVDFLTQKRIEAHEKIKLEENSVVIIEGLHALNPKIYDIFKGENILKLFIYPKPEIQRKGKGLSKFDLRFLRRMVRDYNFRNADVDRSLKMWNDVRSGEKIYMKKYEQNADSIINTFLPYEPCILKKPALTLLNQVSESSPYSIKVARLKNILNLFNEIDVKLLPDNSLLNEFVKKY